MPVNSILAIMSLVTILVVVPGGVVVVTVDPWISYALGSTTLKRKDILLVSEASNGVVLNASINTQLVSSTLASNLIPLAE